MKKIILSLVILISSINLFSQISFKTGDIELETDLNEINAKAKVDYGVFKAEMAITYDIEEYFAEGTIYDETGIYLDSQIMGVDACFKFVSSTYSKPWGKPLKFMIDNKVVTRIDIRG